MNHIGNGQKSLMRATAVIGMAPDLKPEDWDHSELDKYGLGKGEFLLIFLIFVSNGRLSS
jgi:hypothetical protein